MTWPSKTIFLSPPFPEGPFMVQGYGYREAMPAGLIDRPGGTGDFLIMLFHTAARAGNSDQASLRPGGFFFVWNPGSRQYYGNMRKGYVHSWIHCHENLAEVLLGRSGIPCLLPLTLPVAPFLAFLQNLHRELTEGNPDPIIAANLFENWGRQAARHLRRERPSIPAPLRAVRQHIDRHFAESLSLADLARVARLSPSHFSAEFRRHFGMPPVDYMIRRRLHHAAYLLQDINLSVTEVASRVGYDDLFHFSKLFKRCHGFSPRAYRSNNREGMGYFPDLRIS